LGNEGIEVLLCSSGFGLRTGIGCKVSGVSREERSIVVYLNDSFCKAPTKFAMRFATEFAK
jgi:hypothetical protein